MILTLRWAAEKSTVPSPRIVIGPTGGLKSSASVFGWTSSWLFSSFSTSLYDPFSSSSWKREALLFLKAFVLASFLGWLIGRLSNPKLWSSSAQSEVVSLVRSHVSPVQMGPRCIFFVALVTSGSISVEIDLLFPARLGGGACAMCPKHDTTSPALLDGERYMNQFVILMLADHVIRRQPMPTTPDPSASQSCHDTPAMATPPRSTFFGPHCFDPMVPQASPKLAPSLWYPKLAPSRLRHGWPLSGRPWMVVHGQAAHSQPQLICVFQRRL